MPWDELIAFGVGYLLSLLAAAGKCKRLMAIVRALVKGVEAVDDSPLSVAGNPAKDAVKTDPAAADPILNMVLDKVSPHEEPRVSKGRKVLEIIKGVLPIVSAFRPRPR
jgi:hypothetical protein